MKKVVYFMICYIVCFIFCFVLFGMNVNALMIDREQSKLESYNNLLYIDSLDEEYKIIMMHNVGDVVFESTDESIFTISSDGVITPKKDGAALLKYHDDEGNDYVTVIVTAYGDIYKELEEYLDSVEEEKTLKYVQDFKIYNNSNEELIGLLNDYIWAEFNNEESKIYADIEFNDENSVVKMTPYKSFEIKTEYGYIYESAKLNKSKEIKIKYAEYNSEDEKIVSEFGKTVKAYYNSYLNKSYEDMFSLDNENNQELMLRNTPIYKEMKKLGIDYIIDARYGDNTPGQALYGGQLVLGKNGVYYGMATIEIRQILLIPTVETGKNILDAIKEYFMEYLLNDNEEVKVEQIDEDNYRAIVTEKKDTSLIALISNFFVPKVYAEEGKVIEFSVEQTDDEIDEKLEELVVIKEDDKKEETSKDEVEKEEITNENDTTNKEEDTNKPSIEESEKDNTSIENNTTNNSKEENDSSIEKNPATGDQIIMYVCIAIGCIGIILFGLKKIKNSN